ADGGDLRVQSPNNLGDLALHITHIKNFANGVSIWPDNPIYVSGKLRYPAGIDLFNALLTCLHVDLARGLIWTGLLASLATFYAFYRWGGAFGIAGFLFNGGIAGFQFFTTLKFIDYQAQGIAWKSIPLAMFVTQRGLLYAIPAGLLLLWHWREKFFRAPAQARPGLSFWVELSLYASMPLFHVHTFLALSAVLVFIFGLELFNQLKVIVNLVRQEGRAGMRSLLTNMARWGDMRVTLLLTSAIIPATFFVWLVSDNFQAKSVFDWHPGWVQDDGAFAAPFFRIGPVHFGDAIPFFGGLLQITWNDIVAPFFQFWLTNFGVWIPLVLMLIGLCAGRMWKSGWRWGEKLPEDFAFLLPAAAIFVFAFFVKTAPWGWDNIKIIVWAYFLVLPFLWTELIARWEAPVRAGVCVVLFASGFVSLFGGLRLIDGKPGFTFANRAELATVAVGIRKIPVEARFACFPTYNHPLLLNGRKVVMGYPGHLWSLGFEYTNTEAELGILMRGDGDWKTAAKKLGVRYLFWGEEEKTQYSPSKWERLPNKVSSGQWGAIYDLEALAPPSPSQ
ncbi:MAG: hypothetical protein QOI96_1508, partial [Verrucomicrobiota bacterium]